MAYSTPRDELLLAILLAVVATRLDGGFGLMLSGTALVVGLGSYLAVGVLDT